MIRIRLVAAWMGLLLLVVPAEADSAIDLLSGFDESRIESAYPPTEQESLGELAKLLYRLQSVSERTLRSRVGESSRLGDAVLLDGELTRARRMAIPDSLVEFLEFTHLFIVDFESSDGPRRVIVPSFPADAQSGDRISGAGVAIETNDRGECEVIAASQVQWLPTSTEKPGWKLLGQAGFDVALLSDTQQRSRQPLVAEDGDAFYGMLAAADRIGRDRGTARPPRPKAVDLLKKPEKQIGNWLGMTMETVQITRISVTEPARQEQLGKSYYYQIDAVVDLGEVVVRIDPPKNSDLEPAVFQNRYPVSVVVAELPEFLSQGIRDQEGGDAVVSQLRVLVGVDGFYYRLWSYESEFMTQRGGGEQFGPLIVAANIRDLSQVAEDPAGVQVIGWIAAGAVVVAIVFFWIWSQMLAVRDRRAKKLRKQREAERIQLPGV